MAVSRLAASSCKQINSPVACSQVHFLAPIVTTTIQNTVINTTSLSLSGNLEVDGSSRIGNVSTSSLTVLATSSFQAPVAIGATLAVGGALAAEAAASVAGLLTAAGGLSVTGGSTAIGGTGLAVAPAATFSSSVGISGTLTAQGNVSLGVSSSNSLTVAATAALQAPVLASSTLGVGGLLTASGGLTAAGATLIQGTSLAVSSPASFTSTTNVSGSFIAASSVFLGSTRSSLLTVNATAAFTSPVSMSGEFMRVRDQALPHVLALGRLACLLPVRHDAACRPAISCRCLCGKRDINFWNGACQRCSLHCLQRCPSGHAGHLQCTCHQCADHSGRGTGCLWLSHTHR